MSESVKLYNPSGREVKVAADKVQEHLVRGFTYAPTAPKKVVEKIIANAKANKASVALVNKSAPAHSGGDQGVGALPQRVSVSSDGVSGAITLDNCSYSDKR